MWWRGHKQAKESATVMIVQKIERTKKRKFVQLVERANIIY